MSSGPWVHPPQARCPYAAAEARSGKGVKLPKAGGGLFDLIVKVLNLPVEPEKFAACSIAHG